MRTVILLVILAVLVVAAVVLSTAPLMTVIYYETEPYITTETYYVNETYTEKVPIEYEVVDAQIYNCWWRMFSECSVTLKNAGNESGYFRVAFGMITQPTDVTAGKTVAKAAWIFLAPGEKNEVTVRHDGDYVEVFTYSITPPIREITTYQQVLKTREVTQYRDVAKSKKVTVLEYLTQ